MTNIALILAAGRGTRFDSVVPKQYLEIDHISLLKRSILKFINHVDYIQVVIHPDDLDLYNKIAHKLAEVSKAIILPPIYGGASRQDSVKNGLIHLSYLNPKNILIHDAVRPFISEDIIIRIISALKEYKGVIPACRSVDTIKQVIDYKIVKTLNREDIYQAQTPQGFDYQSILKSYETLNEVITDDAMALEKLGIEVLVIDSDPSNFKITHKGDINLHKKEMRVGIGFDAHRFGVENNSSHIMIGGIEIPFNKFIIAHSDGDVVLHALVDAMLGAIGEGDIGMHFPDDDEKYKNEDSSKFVKFALELLHNKNATIMNVDIIIIAQKPKFSLYREQMRVKLAELLAIDISRINVKATTTEQMGFIGREEGIASQVVMSIEI